MGVGEIGEIVIRGENIMKGYWNRPDATAEAIRDGWFHTGDLATRDEDGYYFIVDRLKDMIIRNGFNVYPREVEEVLYRHPAVAEAAVFGVPDAAHGEEIAALITLKEGASATDEEIADYVKSRDRDLQVPADHPIRPDPQRPDRKDPQARDQVRLSQAAAAAVSRHVLARSSRGILRPCCEGPHQRVRRASRRVAGESSDARAMIRMRVADQGTVRAEADGLAVDFGVTDGEHRYDAATDLHLGGMIMEVHRHDHLAALDQHPAGFVVGVA